jgi:hypothetical protein
MREGGGALFINAGGSSFYGWQDYHKIAIGRWGPKTSHGAIGPARISMGEWEYPFYFRDFDITDEIWENTEISSSARELATAQKLGTDGKPENQSYPAVLATRFGQGRSVYTILGHDASTMANPGFQEMMLKAAGWAARTEVSSSGYFGTLQFRKDRKPHIHPLISPNGTVLTEESPKDHLWHMGLWFSWKFIDGLNYWEYTDDPKMHISEGMTDIQIFNTDIVPPHASLAFDLDIIYHPWDKPGEPVMTEVQRDTVYNQFTDGSYHIVYDFTFTALKDLTLDRTPIPGEPGGQSWGGYSGMSMRLNNAFRDVRYFTTNNEPVPYGKTARWVACEFDNGTGTREQVIISDDPGNPRYPAPWYCIADAATPMYYFSPAILYRESMKLRKGEVLHLKYRVWLPKKVLSAEDIERMVEDSRL